MQLCESTSFRAGGILGVTAMALAAAWPLCAQQRLVSGKPDFKADSTLVLVPVTVVDHRGAIVNGLTSNAFTLTENGVRQPISAFSEEDAPVSIGIVLDLSGSMKRVLGAAKESLRTLLKDSNPADEAFLNAVSTRPRPYCRFTQDFDGVLSRIAFEDAEGNTALIDTIYDSFEELRAGVHLRKALLVISDGMDNHSRHTKQEMLERALESDAQIYTIAVANWAPNSKAIELVEARRGVLFLDELAARTGGLSFIVGDRTDIEKAAASIGQALRNQYTIGYVPRDDGRSGQWRRIRVKVTGSGLRAYARSGYRLD